jgi:hypothetical protein
MIRSTFRLSYVRAECHPSPRQTHCGGFTAHLKVVERLKSTFVQLTGTKPRPPSLQPIALTEICAFQSTFNKHALTSTYYFKLNCVRFEHSTPNKQKKKKRILDFSVPLAQNSCLFLPLPDLQNTKLGALVYKF